MKDHQFVLNIDGKTLTCYYICTHLGAEKLITRLLQQSTPVLGFDIETGKKEEFRSDSQAGLCPYRSWPSLVQFYDGIASCYMFDTHYLNIHMLQPIFDVKRVIAHNAIFDVQHLTHNGIDNLRADCSMVMYNLVRCAEHACLEEEETALETEWEGLEGEGQVFDFLGKGERMGASLRVVVAKLLGIRVEKELQTSNWTDRPLSKEQLIYAAQDSWLTYEIGKILSARILELGLGTIYKLNRDAIQPVCRMILNGCELDVKQHAKDIKQWSKELDGYQAEVLRYFGSATKIRSTYAIAEWLKKNLPTKILHEWPKSINTGRLRSDAKTLNSYSHLKFVKPLLDYKRTDKMLNTYGQSLIDKVCPVTKRLHGSFTIGYTATGRLSSRHPNLQNLPRNSSIRGIFRAAKGTQLLGADYSQIELRVAAELSRDQTMLKAYRRGLDLHTLTASSVTGKSFSKITKEERQLGKALGFGLLFGLGPAGLIEYARWNYGVTLSEDQAYNHYNAFFKTYSGYRAWQDVKRAESEKTRTTSTQLGKLRKLREKGIYTRAVNHPVQGSAAEIVITALCNLHKKIDHKHIKMINCVHDEFILEVPESHIKQTKELLTDCMEQAALKVFPKMVLNGIVEAKVGKTWAETK